MMRLAGLCDGEELLPEGVEPGERDGNIIPDFKNDVRFSVNKRLIAQAAYIVYRDQTVSKIEFFISRKS